MPKYRRLDPELLEQYNDLNGALRSGAGIEVIRSMVSRGLKPNNEGAGSINIVLGSGAAIDLEIIELLMDNGAELTNGVFGSINHALKNKNINLETIKFLVENDAKINNGILGALSNALENKNVDLEMIRYLVDKGAKMSDKQGDIIKEMEDSESLKRKSMVVDSTDISDEKVSSIISQYDTPDSMVKGEGNKKLSEERNPKSR